MAKSKKTIHKPKYEKIITQIKQARLDAGMSQEYVADTLDKYASYVSKIEHGDRRVDVTELIEFAQLYGKDIKYFVEDDKSKNYNVSTSKQNKAISKPKYEKIIAQIKQARIDAGMSQEYVADVLDKYASYVSKIEHGDRRVDVVELIEFAQLYGKDIKFFVEDDVDKKNK